MTKSEIINALAQRCGVTQAAARQFYEALNETVMEGLRNEQMVKIKGLGTFKTVSVKARKSVSVNGGEEIEIPAHDKVTFTAEKSFAELVNEPLAHLEVVDLDEPSEDDSPAEEPQEEPADDYKISARMKKLGEEAEALKGLLADINGTSPVETERAPSSNNNENHPPVETERAPSSNNTADHPPVETERAPSSNNTADQPPVETEHASSFNNTTEETPERKITHGGMLGRIFLCVLLLLLVGFGAFYWVKFSDNEVDAEEEKPVVIQKTNEKPQVKEEVPAPEPEVKEEEVNEPVVEKPKEEPQTVKPSTEKKPTGKPTIDELRKIKIDYTLTKGTETVREGSRLTMISLRAFGDKRFWIYIYLANRDQLRSPGEIQTGMIIKIPKLDSRLTDASNPDCLKLAKELEAKYVK